MSVRHFAAVVALALALPAAAADAEAGKRKAEVCGACHGVDGNSAGPEFPSLAAQPPLYLLYQLLNFATDAARATWMVPFAASLSDGDMKDHRGVLHGPEGACTARC